MKRLGIIFFLISINLFCQDYINVQLNSGYKYGLLDDISKITFNAEGTVINFELTSGGTDSENLDDILKITFDSEALGDVSLPVELQDFRAIQDGDDIFLIHNNYPNPFNPTTIISYEIGEQEFTTMKIYDMTGKKVAVLVNEIQNPGQYTVKLNGSNLSSGVYFCKFTSGSRTKIIKMLLVK